MNLLLIIIVVLVLCGGWYGHSTGVWSGAGGYAPGLGIGGIVLLILLIMVLLGWF